LNLLISLEKKVCISEQLLSIIQKRRYNNYKQLVKPKKNNKREKKELSS
jgi:hypothetical protein